MTEHKAIEISRRAFLAGGTAMAADLFLPKIPGTLGSFLVPLQPEAAWADEVGAEATIMVVGRKQMGIAVGDMGTFDPQKKTIRALSGAKVILHSFYNGKEVFGVTDETGKVVLDIDSLCSDHPAEVSDPVDSNGKQLDYRFFGMLTITRKGYRDVVIPYARFRSLSAFIAPTRALKQGEPYLRQLSFDLWDIQYTKAEFVSSSLNTEEHAFSAEIWLPARKSVTFRLHYKVTDANGNVSTKEIASRRFYNQGTFSNFGYFMPVTFEGKYLCSGHAQELPDGCKVYATLEYDGIKTTVSTGLEVTASPFVGVDGGEIETESTIDINPDSLPVKAADAPATQDLITDESLNMVRLPNANLPKPIAGSTFTVWKPSFPHLMFDFSPLGYLMVGVKLGSLNLAYEKDENTNKYSWKKQPRQTAKEQLDQMRKEQKESMDKVKDMYKPDSTTGKSRRFAASCTREITLKGGFQAYGIMSYDWDEELWSGEFNALVGLAAGVSWTIQMLVVVVPVYITIEVGGQITAGIKLAMTSAAGINPKDIIKNAVFEKGDSVAPSVALTLSLGFTVGIGVAGVLCAYVRGAGYITFSVAYPISSKTGKPRFRVGVGAEATVGVQVFLFSWSGTIWSGDWPALYDSDVASQAAVQSLMSNGSLPVDEHGIPQITEEELARNMRIVTNGELMGTAEFGPNDRGVALFANEEPVYVEPVELGNGNLLWDVPPMNGAEEDGVALLAGDDREEYFIYLGNSNTNAELPSSDAPSLDDPLRAGIAGVSDDCYGGIKPSVDKLVFQNVFSDPRTKTIGSMMFRIATVDYGGEARTRVVYTSLEDTKWDNPHVIEFNPSYSLGGDHIPRSDMYDYDFSVTSLEDTTMGEGTIGYFYLMIISGTRPDGDDTSFATANSKTVVNVVRLKSQDAWKTVWRCDRAMAFVPEMGDGFVSFSSPGIVSYTREGEYSNWSCALGACLVRKSSTLESLFSEESSSRLVAFYLKHSMDSLQIVVTSTLLWRGNGASKITMGPIAWEDFPNRCRMHVGIVSARGAYIQRIWVNYCNISSPEIEIQGSSTEVGNGKVQRLYPTGRDREFYAVCTDQSLFAESTNAGEDTSYRRDARLYLLRFNFGEPSEFIPVTPVGTCVPSELAISKDGRFLFYMVNKEGLSSRGFTENGELGPEKTDEQAKADNSYRLMAMARVGDLFTQPFTLASLDHPIDYVASMVNNGATASIVGAQIVDAKNSIADIYDIRIPLAIVGTPLSIAPEGPFAFAGEDTVFDVTLRNDGNTILTGGKFNLYKVTVNPDGTETVDEANPDATADVMFEPNVMVLSEGEDAPAVSVYDLEALPDEYAASPLASAADQGVLLPGQTLTFKVTFRIPADWASKGASDGSTSSGIKVRVMLAEPHYMEYGNTSLLRADNAGENAGDQEGDVSNGDFDDLTEEDWLEFIGFLILLQVLYESDPDDWPEVEINIMDGGLAPENFDNLLNVESTTMPSGIPSLDDGGNGSGSNDGSGASGALGGKGSRPDSIPATGDDNFIGKLLFGNKR